MSIYKKVSYNKKSLLDIQTTIEQENFLKSYFKLLFYVAFALFILILSILLPIKILWL